MLKGLGEDIFTESLVKQITDMYTEAVKAEVDAKVDLVVTNELEKMDEEHAKQLDTLMDNMDKDHLAKMKTIVESMDSSYTEKLMKVAEKYEVELGENANVLREHLENTISNYLELYLDKAFPAETVKEAVANTKATKTLARIRDVVGIDSEYIGESVKTAVTEAHDTIASLKAEVAKTLEENAKLKIEYGKTKSSLVLEQKMRGFDAAKRDYITRKLGDKSESDVTANYGFVLEMYEKDELDRRDAVRSRTEPKTQTMSNKIDTPANKRAINENVEDSDTSPNGDLVQMGLDALNEMS